MVIKKLSDVLFAEMKGYEGVTKKIVLGPTDGSNEIVLRYFSLQPGGTTPHHSHDFPHLVKIEKGDGTVIDAAGNERQLNASDFIYIKENEKHNFKNTGPKPFDFICIVPKRGES